MKEAYFTPDSIRGKSLEMLRKVEKHRERHNLPFIPAISALLVLDMQRYFLERSSHAYIPSAQAIIEGVRGMTEAYFTGNLPVIITRHLNSPQNANLMGRWWRELISEEDPLSEIIPEMNFPGAIVIQKSQYDAFYKTGLEGILREKGVRQVVICGVMTHLCCETTARSAFIRGFEVFFPIDGTATYREELHRASLLNLSHGFAVPVLLEEMLGMLRARNES